MDSAHLFQGVFVPRFATKLAELGYPIRTDEDMQHLLKLAGQLKAVGAKSSLEIRSDMYKSATESMNYMVRQKAAYAKKSKGGKGGKGGCKKTAQVKQKRSLSQLVDDLASQL